MRTSLFSLTVLFALIAAPAMLIPADAAPTQQETQRPMLRAAHADLTCEQCHGVANPVTIPQNAACLECHGTIEELVDATQTAYALNPHTSPHWGTDVPCAVCHRQHQPSRVLCAPCHTNQQYQIK